MELLDEIINCIPHEKEKVEDYIVIFLDCICNNCDSVGFNWKINRSFKVVEISQI